MMDLLAILNYISDRAVVKVWIDNGSIELPTLIASGDAEDIIAQEEYGIYTTKVIDEYAGYIDIYVKEIN